MEQNSAQKLIIVAAITLVVGVGVGYYVADGKGKRYGEGMHRMTDGRMMKDGMMQGNADQHFIIQMIPHHQGAIDMAKVALERSKRPEIIKLSNDIIAAQTKEIDEMKAWYKAWYASDVPEGGMGMHMGGMSGDISVLKSIAAVDFDKEFMEQMIPHHEMALMMAQMIRDSERPEMRQLAENVVTSQSREIELMRSWLKAW